MFSATELKELADNSTYEFDQLLPQLYQTALNGQYSYDVYQLTDKTSTKLKELGFIVTKQTPNLMNSYATPIWIISWNS